VASRSPLQDLCGLLRLLTEYIIIKKTCLAVIISYFFLACLDLKILIQCENNLNML